MSKSVLEDRGKTTLGDRRVASMRTRSHVLAIGMIVPPAIFSKLMICNGLLKWSDCADTPDASEIEKSRPIIGHF